MPRRNPARSLLGLPLIAGLLAGCGSQIDSIDVPLVRPTSPAPAGIYSGTLTEVSAGRTYEVTALVSSERIFLFDAVGDLIAGGRYEAGNRNLNWRARAFTRNDAAEEAEAEEDELIVRAIVAEGVFDARQRILMSFTTSVEGAPGVTDSGTLSWTYARSAYERRSDLPLLAGIWVNEDAFGTATASFTIGQGGELFGQDASGCNFSGNLALIDQKFNLYGASIRIQCAGSAALRLESGLATLRRESSGGETLLIVTTGAATATLLQLKPG